MVRVVKELKSQGTATLRLTKTQGAAARDHNRFYPFPVLPY